MISSCQKGKKKWGIMCTVLNLEMKRITDHSISMSSSSFELDGKKIIAGIDTTLAVVKRNPEKKIRLVRDSNPMTSAIPVQRSNQLS